MLNTILLLATETGSQLAADVVLIVICVLMGAYLFAALLWPEKF
jgi:K+-transporting ATPase KdpF subunit